MNLLTFGLVICQWQDHREQGKATIGILLGHLPMGDGGHGQIKCEYGGGRRHLLVFCLVICPELDQRGGRDGH